MKLIMWEHSHNSVWQDKQKKIIFTSLLVFSEKKHIWCTSALSRVLPSFCFLIRIFLVHWAGLNLSHLWLLIRFLSNWKFGLTKSDGCFEKIAIENHATTFNQSPNQTGPDLISNLDAIILYYCWHQNIT